MEEQQVSNLQVVGSIPTVSTITRRQYNGLLCLPSKQEIRVRFPNDAPSLVSSFGQNTALVMRKAQFESETWLQIKIKKPSLDFRQYSENLWNEAKQSSRKVVRASQKLFTPIT